MVTVAMTRSGIRLRQGTGPATRVAEDGEAVDAQLIGNLARISGRGRDARGWMEA